MINYSITMRSVNTNLLEINQAKSRINQAKREGKNPDQADLIATVFMCAFFVVILLERYYFPTIGINIDQMIFGGLLL